MKEATWKQDAACRNLDPNMFFPDRDDAAGPALAVCATCPVREACLEYALVNRLREGIWGGATERERRRLARQRRSATAA
jgi:WhiB family redox-sensing transcriptional regulator